MENEIFRLLVEEIFLHPAAPSKLSSGNGVRFKSSLKGKATVYHSGIAPGNHAEVAFDRHSMASRLSMTEGEFGSFVAELWASTGRPVESNSQYNWVRVGIAAQMHVALIGEALRNRLRAMAI